MVRKLALAVSLTVGTLPLSVYALGLGEIRTSSALNEKFEAEIELLSVEKGELDTLKVGLAPASVFAQTGVERSFLLSQLKFTPERTRDGRAVIRVTSKVPIREPFLDFFIQVAWPKGQLVREYTVLLDPPVLTRRQAPKVVVAESSAASGSGSRANAARSPAGRYSSAVPGGEYGPIRSNETLWSIAERLRPAGISVHQMMVALYKANPHAFLNNNINLLKKGRVLRIPGENEIRSIGKNEAVAEFGRLSKGWAVARNARSGGSVAPEKVQSATAAMSGGRKEVEQARLKIAGVKEKALPEPGAGESEGAREGKAEALRQKLLLVEEEAATARQEAENLRARMDAMEAKMEEMTRLLKLKDEELARLQAQAGGADTATGETEPEAMANAEVEAAEELPGDGMEMTGETALATTAGETAPESALEEENESAGVVVSEEPAPLKPAENVVKKAAGPRLAEQPVPAGESWLQWLTDNWKLVAGGGGVVLLGLVGLAFSRRRKTVEDQEIAPSVVVPPAESGESESILDTEGAALQQAVDSTIGDTSFLSEYSTEELRALNEDTVEVDPVSEADVYIAYGRYSQAEEILREAMENGNESAAIRHKMLEVYYATQKKEEFRKLAEQMKAAGQDKEDPKAWEHIQIMGRDLDRNNPLFAAAAAAGAMKPDAPAEEESRLSLDLSTLAEEVDSALNPDSQPADSFSNLDLELPSLQIEPRGLKEDGGDKQEEVSDLELNETDLHTELGDISDLGDIGIESNMLDDTLADLADDLEKVMTDSQVLDQPLDLDEGTISALDASAREPADEKAPGRAVSREESSIGDEVETKLELARAFLEIGDADGARSILHEVQQDGTPSQQKAASQLLSQLEG